MESRQEQRDRIIREQLDPIFYSDKTFSKKDRVLSKILMGLFIVAGVFFGVYWQFFASCSLIYKIAWTGRDIPVRCLPPNPQP